MQEVEYCACKIGKEEYQRILSHELDLQPEGGCRFMMELVGAGYTHSG